MTTFKDMEENFRNFIIQEQSDAHSQRTLNVAKYNNLKLSMSPNRFSEPHIIIRITISEAAFSIEGGNKINGGLGYEERFVQKWFNRFGVKDKLKELWNETSDK